MIRRGAVDELKLRRHLFRGEFYLHSFSTKLITVPIFSRGRLQAHG